MATPLKILAPPGYGRLVPLDRQRHAGLGLRPGLDHAWCSRINAVFVGAAEMSRAALDYPVAFLRESATGEFAPVAVLGLHQDQNLFVEGGRWRENTYIPAYLRRYPFCLVDIPSRDGQEAQHLVCVQEDCLTPSAAPLFDSRGAPTAAWQPLMQLLESIERARQQTRALCMRLEALQLLVPFDAVAVPRAGRQSRLQGLHRVDEQKLQALSGRELRPLMKRGELRAVYAHLLSLENFGRLLDLAQARATG